MIEDAGDRVPNRTHDVLDRTLSLIGVWAVAAFLIRRFADTADGRKRPVEDADDLAECDGIRRFDQSVATLHPTAAGQ